MFCALTGPLRGWVKCGVKFWWLFNFTFRISVFVLGTTVQMSQLVLNGPEKSPHCVSFGPCHQSLNCCSWSDRKKTERLWWSLREERIMLAAVVFCFCCNTKMCLSCWLRFGWKDFPSMKGTQRGREREREHVPVVFRAPVSLAYCSSHTFSQLLFL